MLPAEAEEQIRLNLRSVRANDRRIKLLDSRDPMGQRRTGPSISVRWT
jgi:hypothetical protein